MFFLRKTSTIHIELLFRNAPAKSSWTDLFLAWFAGATPESIIVKPRWGGGAINPKIVQKSCNNILLNYFRALSDNFREVSEYFREVGAYFREVIAYFRWDISFQNFETGFEKFGAIIENNRMILKSTWKNTPNYPIVLLYRTIWKVALPGQGLRLKRLDPSSFPSQLTYDVFWRGHVPCLWSFGLRDAYPDLLFPFLFVSLFCPYNCWSRGSAEQIWGEFFILACRILGNLPASFSANSDGEFWSRLFRPCFSRVSGLPKKFTPKIHAQTCWHSSPISLSRTQFFFTPLVSHYSAIGDTLFRATPPIAR